MPKPTKSLSSRLWNALGVENRILLAGFLITLSFTFTQVPIFYAFHLMECDVYYSHHPPYTGPGDRCSRDEITAGTATQFSILGMSTTFFGTMNLFVAGWMVKKWGPRRALMAQTFVPAVRVATQIWGVLAGGQRGITIFQLTQMITIVGGPAGYILIVNIIAGEVVEPARRTSVFGKLQGCIMLGNALGYLTGGQIGDVFGIVRPFQVACVSFLISTAYVQLALPYISPESLNDGKKATKGISGFLAPLRILSAQKLRLRNGSLKKHFGVLFLCCGIFLGVLATGYAPFLIQMYATAAFDFNQADNGWLMSEFAFMRSVFLIFIFPKVISWGRKWFKSRGIQDDSKEVDDESVEEFPDQPEEIPVPTGSQNVNEPVAAGPLKEHENSEFDLFFLRWSLVVDGLLTTLAAFATEGWHIYLAAFFLPFGSGSAPAAKGVISEMCPSSQRADALNAVTLIENIARLATQGLFGFIFSALARTGNAYLTFFCNAALAVLAMGVLLFSHFPPPGSALIEEGDEEAEGNTERDE